MEKDKKAKVIIFAVFGIIVLLTILIVSAFSGKKKDSHDSSKEDISLRAERKNDFTTEDMMKAQENKTNYDNSTSAYSNLSADASVSTNQSSVPHYQGDNSEVAALQKQLRENQKNQDDNNVETPAPAPVVHKKNKSLNAKITQTNSIEEKEQIQPAPVQKVINTNPNGRSRNLVSNSQNQTSNLISAVIHNDQVITNGGKVKIRITDNIIVDGLSVPRNSFVYGIASFSKTRMNVTLQSIIVGSSIIPFSKMVYDKDGMEGIYLPENIKSEDATQATNDMTDEALNNINSAGIVGAALNTGKNIFRRKAQRQTVTLKANYKIFLK